MDKEFWFLYGELQHTIYHTRYCIQCCIVFLCHCSIMMTLLMNASTSIVVDD